jgi:drug/metabolite transporter (DMT)-like permease
MTTSKRLAIYLMFAQAVLFAAETAVVHQIGAKVDIALLAFLRGAAGVALAVVICGGAGAAALRTDQLWLQLLRGIVSLLYLWVMLFSFSRLPFSDATAISYTQAIYIMLFSVLILKESVRWSLWLTAGVGISGALLIAQPAGTGYSVIYLFALVGTSLNGLAFVLNRYLQRKDSAASTMLYTNIVMAVGNLPGLLWAELPTAGALPWCIGLVLFGPLGMYVGIVALKQASAASLAPYTLLRLVIGMIGGVIFFEEMPTRLSACGALLILGSCVRISSESGAQPFWRLRLLPLSVLRRFTHLLRPQSKTERPALRSAKT